MRSADHIPTSLDAGRILGAITPARRELLAMVDVALGHGCALHASRLRGWHVEAALVERRPDFRGGDTLALRMRPESGRAAADVAPPDASTIEALALHVALLVEGIARVVPDIAATAPDTAALGLRFDTDGIRIVDDGFDYGTTQLTA